MASQQITIILQNSDRENIIEALNYDIISLNETFLKQQETRNITNYKWFGNNRTNLHPRANRGSGGVGFLIKEAILENYEVFIIDNNTEDIIWLKLQHKEDITEYLYICSCYLPPEGSTRENRSQEFFDHLLTTIYTLFDENPLIICSDFNSRIGKAQDVNIDNFPNRIHLDAGVNQQGKALLDFLSDSSLCVLNSRIDTDHDNFTSVRNGKAVVDYIITPTEGLHYIKDVEVNLTTTIAEKYNIAINIPVSKMPDHSILKCTVELSPFMNTKTTQKSIHTTSTGINWSGEQLKRFRMDKLNDGFFKSTRIQSALRNTINSIENNRTSATEISKIYEELTSEIQQHMEEVLDVKNLNKTTTKNRKAKHHKPFWNENLSTLWKETCKVEKEFLNYKGNRKHTAEKREKYHKSRRNFDKELRRADRKYNAERRDRIDQLDTNNPKEFWREVNSLGPKSTSKVDYRTKTAENTLETDPEKIKNKWKSEFSNLYNETNNVNFDNDFLTTVTDENRLFESDNNAPNNNTDDIDGNIFVDPNIKNITEITNEMLNLDISMEEVSWATGKTKLGKSSGYDNITNEILKSEHMTKTLHTLYARCFNTGIAPEQWFKSIITPIYKQGKEKNEPLSHRGISLMSTVAKVFDSILTNRVNHYLEFNGLLADEQNGFRKERSCLEHIFSLTTIVNNRTKQGLPTHTCFIDMAKAFDSVNHELLWYSLRKMGISGRMYNVIQYMYSKNQASINLGGYITGWFRIKDGVRQGDNLAPTLFGIFINSLVKEVNSLNCGVTYENHQLSILLYADDIVLLSETEDGLQKLLDTLNKWTNRFRMNVNMDKTNVVHFRPKKKKVTQVKCKLGEQYITLEGCP
jgi:hypothetical protein